MHTAHDPHSYGNTHDVRPSHLSLDLTLDFDRCLIHGSCTLTLVWSQTAAGHVDLDSKDLTIAAVSNARGDALRYEVGAAQAFMGSRLRIYVPDQQEQVCITYSTAATAAALQWLTPAQTTSGKWPFLFTQSQAILARTWFPCMDSPGVRVSYDATVRVPAGMMALMSAKQQPASPEQGVFRFHMPLPIPAYLIALAVGEIAYRPLSHRTGVYAEPDVLAAAAWEFAEMEHMMRAAEGLYGPYRWGHWDAIVLPPSFPFGGMENPLLTFATPTILAGDRSLVSVMAHELAHSWSGNLVTNATWNDFWLNEGCTTYFERRIVEILYGTEVAEMHWLLGQRALQRAIDRFSTRAPEFTKLAMRLDGHDPDDAFSELPYEKGANFLRVLERYCGRASFDAFLQTYFAEHAFQSMSTARFLEILQDRLLQGDATAWEDLQVEAWVYEPGVPDNIVVPISDRFAKTHEAAAACMAYGSLAGVHRNTWTTAEWIDFLRSLPQDVPHDKLALLDQTFALSRSGNSEILFAWLEICIRNTYTPAWPVVEDFLCRQGRRKFLQPLYEALWANSHTRELAQTIYGKARTGYHPIAVATIDHIVNA
jgi:leukotriene A-4 hydrolase/aminopeptidase